MDAPTVLKRLGRHPIACVLGLVLAVAVGIALTYRVEAGALVSRQHVAGIASASVLLDSATSQVSDLGDPEVAVGTDELIARAHVLANLLLASPLRERIAASAQVPPARMITRLASDDPNVPGKTVEKIGVTVRASDPRASILTVRLGSDVPIMTFDAQAPSRDAATRLSNAAVAQLRGYLRPTPSAAAIPAARKLVVTPLGSARSSTRTLGTGRLGVIVAMLLALATWCAGVLAFDGALRRRRAARAGSLAGAAPREQVGPGPPAAPAKRAPRGKAA